MIDLKTETVISVAKAGALLDVSANTVKKFIRAGAMAGAKVGGRWRTSIEAVQRFLDSRETGCVPDAGGPTVAAALAERDRDHARALAKLAEKGLL